MKPDGWMLVLLVLMPLGIGTGLVSCGDKGNASATQPAAKPAQTGPARVTASAFVPGSAIAAAHPVTIGPIDFVAANCAKCHGFEAANHKPADIAKYRDGDKLEQMVKKMLAMNAPTAVVEGEDFHTLVSFHRSVMVHQPFIAVTDAKGPDKDGAMTLEGEVSSKSLLSVTAKGQTTRLALDGVYWTAVVPADATEVTFTATRDGVTTVLSYPEHTHTQDGPPG